MSDKTKNTVEPVVHDKAFFEWFESLFHGDSHFPETVTTRVVTGKNGARLGPVVDQMTFLPQAKLTKEDKSEKGEKSKSVGGKPSREEMVATTNRLIFLMQRDCDQSGRSTTYSVLATHFSRNPEPYARMLFRLKPTGVHANEEGREGDEPDDLDDEEGSLEKKQFGQRLRHHETMFQLLGGGMEGLIDRQDRALERADAREARLQSDNMRLIEMVEKMQSSQHERTLALQWNDLKIRSVEKGLELAINIAPPLLNKLTSKTDDASSEDAITSMTLKNFFKPVSEGGKLTDEQAKKAFGVYDETPGGSKKCTEPGALTEAQTKLLWDVAWGQAPAAELDRLLPGGSMAVEPAQAFQLQQIFSTEQIAPVMMLIMMRNKQNAVATQPQQQS